MIKKINIDHLKSCAEFSELLQEYADECPPKDNQPHFYNEELYRNLELNGLLRVFGAFKEDRLVGFVTVLVTMLPKYTSLVASTESFFVSQPYRKTLAGIKLLRAAENEAIESGAFGMLVSAPHDGPLSKVLPKAGYDLNDVVFFKDLQ